jgi:hypothetical protein
MCQALWSLGWMARPALHRSHMPGRPGLHNKNRGRSFGTPDIVLSPQATLLTWTPLSSATCVPNLVEPDFVLQ